jgi:FlaA1/EpsC-like NDP-sugar epimerase
MFTHKSQRMPDLLLLHRRSFIAIFQIALVCVSLFLAWLLRFDFSLPYRSILFAAAPILILVRLATLAYFGLLRGWWKYAGLRDGMDVLKAVGTGSLLFWVLIRVALRIDAFPRAIYVLEALLTAGLLVGVRLLSRMFAESVRENLTSCKKVIVIGAGFAAELILREIRRSGSGYAPVGCVDDDGSKLGIRINDVPVLGTVDQLPDLTSSGSVDEVLIAVPSATGQQMRRFVDICNRANVKCSCAQGHHRRSSDREAVT